MAGNAIKAGDAETIFVLIIFISNPRAGKLKQV